MTEIHSTLAHKIREIADKLASEHIFPLIVESSYREYSVQAEIADNKGEVIGAITLYFSPRKGTFTAKPMHKLAAEVFSKIEREISGKQAVTAVHKAPKQKQKAEKGLHDVRAYVDGSFLGGRVGYGLVIVQNDTVIFEMSGGVDNPDYVAARQVAGELFSVGKVVQWCRANSVQGISIYYDYAGIEAWATGKWKANQNLTKNYREFIRNCGLKIQWHKVAAHTGDTWNEYADSLAKNGAMKK